MPSNAYEFVTVWELPACPEVVYGILSEPLDLARWWPQVYLDVKEIPNVRDPNSGKRAFALHTKGKLPYTLRWSFRVLEDDRPSRIRLEAWGDFVGEGVWTFEPTSSGTRATYDWRIRADKPLLRSLSWLLKPVFSANHRWAMNQGEISIRKEIERREI